MSNPASSLADFIELIKTLGYARVFNTTFNPTASHPDVPGSDQAIFEIITSNGQRFVFTPCGFTFPGRGFIPFRDVARASWRDYNLHDQTNAHQKYLVISFYARPPIDLFVGDSGTSVSVGGLIKMMKLLNIKPGQLS